MSKARKSHFRHILVCLLTIATLLPMFNISVSAQVAPKNRKVWVYFEDGSDYVTLTATKPAYVNGSTKAERSNPSWNLLYDVTNNTLYMKNYDGGPISHIQNSGPFKIVVMGDNYILNDMPFLDMDDTATNLGAGIFHHVGFGLGGKKTEWDNTLEIYGEKKPDGTSSSLTIDAIPREQLIYGIRSEGDGTSFTGDIDINIKIHGTPKGLLEKACGIKASYAKFYGNSSVKIEMETDEKCIHTYGLDSWWPELNTQGNISIDMTKCVRKKDSEASVKALTCDENAEFTNVGSMEVYVPENGIIGGSELDGKIDKEQFVVRRVNKKIGGIYPHLVVKPGRPITVRTGNNALLFRGYDELDFLAGEKGVVKASDKEAVGKKFYDFGWLSDYEDAHLTPNDDGTYTFTVQPGWFDTNIISPRYCRRVSATSENVNAGTVYVDGDEVYGNVGEQERSNWIVENTTVKLRAVPNPGYKFREWKASASGITFADKTNPNTTYTMYVKEGQGDDLVTACFEEDDIPITFNKMGGDWVSGYTPPASYTFSKSVTLPTAENITKGGQRFAGWYKNRDCTNGPYTVTDSEIVSDITYYAKWEDDSTSAFTINTYPSTGGQIVVSKSKALTGEVVHFSIVPDFGYEFDETSLVVKYYKPRPDGLTELEVTKRTDAENAYMFTMPIVRSGQDVRISASFKLCKYTINYDYNGGTPTIDGEWFFNQDENKTYRATEDKALTLNISGGILKKPGYTFIGWCETPDCSDVPFTEIKKGTKKGDKTLYAAYEHTLYDIETKYYDGDGFKASESEYGKIELDVSQAHLGDRVHFTPIPANGCALVRLYVTEKASAPYSATPVKFDDNYNFTMPENAVYIWAEFEPLRNITLTNDTGYEISPFNSSSLGITSLNPCPMGRYYYFKVNLDSEYTQGPEFKVKANGTELTPDGGGVYNVRAGSTDITITVEGVIPKEFVDKIDVSTDIWEDEETSHTMLTVYAEITSNLEMSGKKAVCAVYNEKGKLLLLKTEPIDVLYGTTYASQDLDLTGITDKKLTIKYFVWNMANTKPLLPFGADNIETE